jgi:hypothetical protein
MAILLLLLACMMAGSGSSGWLQADAGSARAARARRPPGRRLASWRLAAADAPTLRRSPARDLRLPRDLRCSPRRRCTVSAAMGSVVDRGYPLAAANSAANYLKVRRGVNEAMARSERIVGGCERRQLILDTASHVRELWKEDCCESWFTW